MIDKKDLLKAMESFSPATVLVGMCKENEAIFKTGKAGTPNHRPYAVTSLSNVITEMQDAHYEMLKSNDEFLDSAAKRDAEAILKSSPGYIMQRNILNLVRELLGMGVVISLAYLLIYFLAKQAG